MVVQSEVAAHGYGPPRRRGPFRPRFLWLTWIFAAPAIWAANYFQGVSPGNVFWPGGTVPYLFDTNYPITSTQKSVILAGLREWELAANVKFVPYTNQTNYVLLQYTNDGSASGFCLLGTPATMMLHGLARGLMCHEGGHLLGLQHEHQRTDRNSYIVINLNNIIGGTNGEAAFDIDSNSTPFGPYDFESVMHYYPNNFSIGPGYDSLDPLPPYQKYYHKIGNPALSIGDRAAAAHLYGLPATPLTNVVTTTADGGPGSLRGAIYYANDHPGTTIRFNIPNTDPNYANGVFTIYLIGEPPPLVSPGTVIDGTTQPGYAGHPVIALDGTQVSSEAGSVSGLHLYGTNGTVRALAIDNFNYAGVQLFCSDAVSNRVEGCYLGLKSDGTNAGPNNIAGIMLQFGPHNNIIGGLDATQRNVLSGNLQYGALVNDINSDGNAFWGNYIGLNAAGTAQLANGASGIGVWNDPRNTIVGGTNAGARNVISGNMQYGVYLAGANNSGAVIQGNYIGTDFTGSNAVPNGNSITNGFGGIGVFYGAHNVTIGGTSPSARNVISGNTNGVFLAGTDVTNNVVQGNYVGVNVSGTVALPNGGVGLFIFGGAGGNLIGGPSGGAGNVLSGNGLEGVFIGDSGTANNVIQGNEIGTDWTGTNAVGNGDVGVGVWNGATNNLIGGTVAGAANVLSGNVNYGIVLGGANGNLIQGNVIGADPTGLRALGNHFAGVGIWGGATGNTVGGTTVAAANVISGNDSEGILLSDAGTGGNLIEGNFIGVGRRGTNIVANGFCGIGVWTSAGTNTVGGTAAGLGNVVSGNGSYGVVIGGANANGNIVQGNFIGTDVSGKIALANGFAGLAVWGASGGNLLGGTTAGAANLISGNTTYGVFISDTNTSGNLVQGNCVGADITGTNALGNGFANVGLQNGATGNFIGGLPPGAGNTIAFAGGPGVVLYDASTTNNAIRGNSIFGNGALGIDLNNDGVTLNDAGDADTGPNNLQNFPVITNAFGYAASTIVLGKLNSKASRSFSIDVYRNLAADSSGYGEGQFYVGSVSVTTDGSGSALFALTNTTGNYAGQYFSATATSAGGDTGEFGADVPATNQPAPFSQFSGPLVWRTNGFVLTLTLATNFNYRLQATTNLGANPVVWIDLTNYSANSSSLTFTDRTATNYRLRFYRAVSP